MTLGEKRRMLARHRITCAKCGVLAIITHFNADEFTPGAPVLVAVECHGERVKVRIPFSDVEDSTPLILSITTTLEKADDHDSHSNDNHDPQSDAQRPNAGAAAERQRRDARRAPRAQRA